MQRQTRYGVNRGDFHVVVRIDIPKKLTNEEKELLIKLSKVMQMPKKQQKLFNNLFEEIKKNKK